MISFFLWMLNVKEEREKKSLISSFFFLFFFICALVPILTKLISSVLYICPLTIQNE